MSTGSAAALGKPATGGLDEDDAFEVRFVFFALFSLFFFCVLLLHPPSSPLCFRSLRQVSVSGNDEWGGSLKWMVAEPVWSQNGLERNRLMKTSVCGLKIGMMMM